MILYQLGFLESFIRPILGNNSERLSRDFDRHMLIKLRYKNTSLLEINLASHFSARVKLRRPSAIAVASSDLGFLPRDLTFLSHICGRHLTTDY